MTAHEANPAPVPPTSTETTATHAADVLLEHLADRLGGSASVSAVYGEPVTADGVTVIPVAKVAFGLGGGAGRIGDPGTGEGGGAGGGVDAAPVGYIEISNGIATYRPIRRTWTDVAVPLAALVLGAALPKIVQVLRRRR
ncbi:spore germination protein GerW family protein [Streptomyces sp. NPDC057623]|uniref:spore germination protein GerW family protein n=1 Tax=Streptomyces sp. NPDC057623 TaxID=3346187 RepID=UPI0036C41FB4